MDLPSCVGCMRVRRGKRGRDAGAILPTTPADVIYLDPPYAGTSRYNRAYAVLDHLLGDGGTDFRLDGSFTRFSPL